MSKCECGEKILATDDSVYDEELGKMIHAECADPVLPDSGASS